MKHSFFYRIAFPLLMVLLAAGLFIFAIGSLYKRFSTDNSLRMVEDINQLSLIFKKINATAGIESFDTQRNPINFLNIKKGGFVGSEVGSLNLKYPARWDGPYVKDNPTMQGIEYDIVQTNKGVFIVPGNGVRLPNGKVLGKDVIISADTDILALTKQNQALHYQGRALASQIDVAPKTIFDFQREIPFPTTGDL